jgi:NarL family two-component system response regulator LiaR
VPESKILVLSSFAESDKVFQAIKAGAMGYMLKDSTRVQVLQAIRDIASGEAQLQPSMAMKVIHEFNRPSEGSVMNQSLTRRELEALQLIARGFSNQEIATALVVHERTIAKYVSNILNKLHVSNRTQAALYAIREGLAAAAD